jgi:uncharacterized protein with PQ loop repeat
MAKFESLAASAGVLGLVSFSALLYKIFLTYNTSSLPWTWVVSNITAQSLMLAYGVVNKLPGITWPSFVFLLGLVYIVIIKSFHETHDTYNKSVGIKEFQENPKNE